ILDDQGKAVSGATVFGTFGGDISESQSAQTDSTSTAVLTTSSRARNPSNLTFCVDDVTHSSLTYDANANVETCDEA
ncbi:MAG: hypothetical protein WD558_08050, partial [Pseudomonadales bacterium]